MNFRKDIFERMTYIVETEPNRKPNYAKLARQFNCDYPIGGRTKVSIIRLPHNLRRCSVDCAAGIIFKAQFRWYLYYNNNLKPERNRIADG